MQAFVGLHTVLSALKSDRGWTSRELARRANVNASMVSGYLSGRAVPSLDTLDRMLVALGVSVEELGRELSEAQGERVVQTPEVATATKLQPNGVKEMLETAKERFGEAVEYLLLAAEQGAGPGDHAAAARLAVERVAPRRDSKERKP